LFRVHEFISVSPAGKLKKKKKLLDEKQNGKKKLAAP
jgi:hypothetical protein